MHSDCIEFERFSDALITSSSPLEVRNHLKKLVSYLEALVQEISKRSILRQASNPDFSKGTSGKIADDRRPANQGDQ
jgi:hypothetical protein